MIKEDIHGMDINILVSIINTKLRDQYDSLESLCYDLDFIQEEIISKFRISGYKYNELQNQFKRV
ncbi:DUF4250 domain-containing protein [Clostridium uliginosum]|nr:DUF4250 domain-containing protein [Clostridium uliginosum]